MISNGYCNINLSTLLASPFNIVGGDSIHAKVIAANTYGESAQSDSGNGAVYTTIPDAPVGLAENASLRTSTNLGLTWSDGLSDGGLSVIDYRIN